MIRRSTRRGRRSDPIASRNGHGADRMDAAPTNGPAPTERAGRCRIHSGATVARVPIGFFFLGHIPRGIQSRSRRPSVLPSPKCRETYHSEGARWQFPVCSRTTTSGFLTLEQSRQRTRRSTSPSRRDGDLDSRHSILDDGTPPSNMRRRLTVERIPDQRGRQTASRTRLPQRLRRPSVGNRTPADCRRRDALRLVPVAPPAEPQPVSGTRRWGTASSMPRT